MKRFQPRQVQVGGEMIPRIKQPPRSRTQTTPTGWFYERESRRLIIRHPGGKVKVRL